MCIVQYIVERNYCSAIESIVSTVASKYRCVCGIAWDSGKLQMTLEYPDRPWKRIWDTLEFSGTLWNTVRFSETLWDTLKDCVTFGSTWSPLPRHFCYKSPSYNDLANIKLSPFIFRNLWSHQIGAGPLEHFLLKEEWWSVTQCCNMSPGGKRKLPDIRLILRVPPRLPTS